MTLGTGETKKVLYLRGGAFGDFILTLPSLSLLRSHYPCSELHLACKPSVARAIDGTRLIDQVHDIDGRWMTEVLGGGEVSEGIKTLVGSYDLIISHLWDKDLKLRKFFEIHSGATFVQSTTRPVNGSETHAGVQYSESLRSYFKADPVAPFRFGRMGGKSFEATVVIHPGSGSVDKNWPADFWSQCVNELLRRELKIDCLVGEAELERGLPDWITESASGVRVHEELPLDQVRDMMLQAGGFLGHDSGLAHLAAACELPGVVLWRNSDLKVWSPCFEGLKVVRDSSGEGALDVANRLTNVLQGSRRHGEP